VGITKKEFALKMNDLIIGQKGKAIFARPSRLKKNQCG
jgi:hypothetical protein